MNPKPVGNIDFIVMLPDVEHHNICCVVLVCGLKDIAVHIRLIEFEGINKVDNLANYPDTEI
jgi:hypothetical protein